jgi:hypothetical protein
MSYLLFVVGGEGGRVAWISTKPNTLLDISARVIVAIEVQFLRRKEKSLGANLFANHFQKTINPGFSSK